MVRVALIVSVMLFSTLVTSTPLMNTVSEYKPVFSKNYIQDLKEKEKLIPFITEAYDLPVEETKQILAVVYGLVSSKDFPTRIDVLSVISIESAFDKNAKSKAGAKGLMQVLYTDTEYDIKQNITDGVFLLRDYKARGLSTSEVIQAYNMGIGNHYNGRRNTRYLNKFKKAKADLETIRALYS